MALQRARRPRIRSGRSLRSFGSPLNAQLLGDRGCAVSCTRRKRQLRDASKVVSATPGHRGRVSVYHMTSKERPP